MQTIVVLQAIHFTQRTRPFKTSENADKTRKQQPLYIIVFLRACKSWVMHTTIGRSSMCIQPAVVDIKPGPVIFLIIYTWTSPFRCCTWTCRNLAVIIHFESTIFYNAPSIAGSELERWLSACLILVHLLSRTPHTCL